MKGATTDPSLKTINTPHKANTVIIGHKINFFLSFKNIKNSFINEIIITFNSIFMTINL
jgi:hypothetical protein